MGKSEAVDGIACGGLNTAAIGVTALEIVLAMNTYLVKGNTLNVATIQNFEPLIFQDSTGSWTGFEAEILKMFAAILDVDIYFIVYSFDGIWQRPGQKQCDIVAAGLTILDERLDGGCIFSEPTLQFRQSLLINRRAKDEIKCFGDLAGIRVGVIPGTTGEKYARNQAPQNTCFVEFDDEATMIDTLCRNKISAVARGTLGNYYRSSMDSELLLIESNSNIEYVAFSVANQQLLAELNDHLKQLYDDGISQQLAKQWSLSHCIL